MKDKSSLLRKYRKFLEDILPGRLNWFESYFKHHNDFWEIVGDNFSKKMRKKNTVKRSLEKKLSKIII